jgi:pilus assembly protein Flp/PilA
MAGETDRAAEYRIEHREGAARTVVRLGTAPLAPLAAVLAAQGKRAHLAVVETATGRLLIRYPLPAGTDRGGEERGQGLVEYALILVLVSVVAIALITSIGGHVGALFTTVDGAL